MDHQDNNTTSDEIDKSNNNNNNNSTTPKKDEINKGNKTDIEAIHERWLKEIIKNEESGITYQNTVESFHNTNAIEDLSDLKVLSTPTSSHIEKPLLSNHADETTYLNGFKDEFVNNNQYMDIRNS